jgi:HEAT repeat protein
MDEPNMNAAPLPPDEDLTEVRKPASLLVVQFFLFPLIIIAICVGIFMFFGALTYQQRTAADYLAEVTSGSGKQRWQAAFELSTIVKSNPDRLRNPQFIERVIAAHRESRDEDIPVRGYLAIVLGELQDPSSVALLTEGLQRDEKLKSVDWDREGLAAVLGLGPSAKDIRELLLKNQIYTLYALGSIGDNSAVPVVREFAKNREPDIRQVAAWALGKLKDERAVEDLRVLLNDPEDDVRWNAALSLARLGNSESAELLMKLLDQSYADTVPDMTVEQKTFLRINAVEALGILRYEPAKEKIRALSKSDPVLAVREAALEALKKYEAP